MALCETYNQSDYDAQDRLVHSGPWSVPLLTLHHALLLAEPFKFEFEDEQLSEPVVRDLVYDEAKFYHPSE
jgi:hypothetical protein